MPIPHIPALTGLRFFAALWVVGFHYFTFTGPLSFLNPIFSVGHLGVPFFFILSGFIIALNYCDREISFKNFLVLRMARVAPMYYVAFLLALPLLYIHFRNAEYKSDIFGMVFINLFMLQTILPIKAFTSGWNTPAWTISAEMAFYLLFPFIKGKQIGPFKTSLKNLIFLYILSFILYYLQQLMPDSVYLFGRDWKCNFQGIIFFRLINFLVGINLYYVFREHHQVLTKLKPESLFILLAGILLAGIALVPIQQVTAENPFIIIIFSLFILINATSPKLNSFYDRKTWIFLGEASYSLYILQAPLKFYAQQFYSKVLGFTLTKGLPYSLYISFVLILFSALFYLYLEKPARNYIRKRFYKTD